MRKLSIAAAVLLSLTGTAFAADPSLDSAESRHGQQVVGFDTMYGVDGPFVGDTNPIRGVIGDELPWTVTHFIRGELDSSGRLRILVRGLVFSDDPSVPPELRGINDEAEFRGLVSCLTESGDAIETQNVATGGFPATRSGNSFIDTKIELPNPCVAPIIMVLAGSEDKWFAVSGVETEMSGLK
jgi:hypothetical protein